MIPTGMEKCSKKEKCDDCVKARDVQCACISPLNLNGRE